MNGLLVKGMVVAGGYAGGGYVEWAVRQAAAWAVRESGMISTLMSTMPSWLPGGGDCGGGNFRFPPFLGWVIGQVVGRVMYPDPNKPSVLNKRSGPSTSVF